MQTFRLKVMGESSPEIPIKGVLDHGNVPLRQWPASPRMRPAGIYQPRGVREARETTYYCSQGLAIIRRIDQKCAGSMTCSVGGPRSTRLHGPKSTPIRGE